MSESQEEYQHQPFMLDELIQTNDKGAIEAAFTSTPPVDIARMIAGLSKPDQIHLFELLGPEQSAHLISQISDLGTGDLIAQLPTPQVVSIVKEMSRDQQAQLLRTFDDDEAEAILDEIKPYKAAKLRRLMSYPENTAGAFMITEYLSYEGGDAG